jgi:hypothetical protein
MLRVNLLPEEFRVAKKNTQEVPYLKIAAGAAVLFSILTVWFYIDYNHSKGELKKMNATWATLQPQSAQLKALESEVESTLKPERTFLEKYVVTPKPMTYVLSWLSELLPDTAWLTEVKMEQKDGTQNIFVKGLVIPSKTQSSIEVIEGFIQKLKEKLPDAKLSLTTTRQKIEQLEVTQFIANFDLKPGSAPK